MILETRKNKSNFRYADMLYEINLITMTLKKKIIVIAIPIIIILAIIIWIYTTPINKLSEPTGILCKLKGGYFTTENQCRGTHYSCYNKYNDGGKKCSDSSQCKGHCIPSKSCVEKCSDKNSKNGNKMVGTSVGICKTFCGDGVCEEHDHSHIGGGVELKNGYINYWLGAWCD